MLSIVIPTWREAPTIADAVTAALSHTDEVVVVDARSDDGTAAIAQRAGAVVVTAAMRSRGAQLHAGACAARGDVLLFLHADARVGAGASEAIADALADPDCVGGNFRLAFAGGSAWSTVFAAADDLRRRSLGIHYGDSGIFVRRSIYDEVGGFRPLPLFEDYEFVRRLARRGRRAYVRHVTVTASDRRFLYAPMRTLATWAALQGLYSLGVSPKWLARWYADVRATA